MIVKFVNLVVIQQKNYIQIMKQINHVYSVRNH